MHLNLEGIIMARQARVVAPGYPHHITQRGNRRQQTFFEDQDYRRYLTFLDEACTEQQVEVWAYCLMPNHVHLIVVPKMPESLSAAIGKAHRRYTLAVNSRMCWTGCLWQGRYNSFPMDETYLLAAVRYVERNPVEAGLVSAPEDYLWSSARHHVALKNDPIVKHSPLQMLVGDWRSYLMDTNDPEKVTSIQQAERVRQPLGDIHGMCPPKRYR
ncbi:MAG: transposase [Desulfuromonas sp.]|nr:MAG: transposase [Desulfuromonas sp.]